MIDFAFVYSSVRETIVSSYKQSCYFLLHLFNRNAVLLIDWLYVFNIPFESI